MATNRDRSGGAQPEVFGPNVRKLILRKMAHDAVPPGSVVSKALAFLMDHEEMTKSYRKARAWVKAALHAVRLAPQPNPWQGATDEEIAAQILLMVDKKKQP